MEIETNQRVFLLGLRCGIAPEVNGVALELRISLTAEDALADKSDSFILIIPADHADKVISSIQTSLQRLRQPN